MELRENNRTQGSVVAGFWAWYIMIAPREIVQIWSNFLKFGLHYYSVPLLLRTLFAPWHRDSSGYGRGFDLARYFQIWSFNMVSRGVGFVVRLCVILFALACEVMFFCLGLFFLTFWLAAPVALTALSIWALTLLA